MATTANESYQKFIDKAPLERRLKGLTLQQRLKGLPAEVLLEGVPLDVIEAYLRKKRKGLSKRKP